MKAIDENELIEDFSNLIRLPIPDLRLAIWHKAEELKQQFKKDIDEFQKVKEIIEPGKPEKKKEEPAKPVEQIGFELQKKKAVWKVKPVDIPKDIVKQIVNQNVALGYPNIRKFKIKDGRTLNVTFEKHTKDFYTGSIMEKGTEKAKKKTPSKQARKADKRTEKKEDLEIFLTYLMTNETFYDWMIDEFFERLKPLIDRGIFKKSSKNSLI